MLSAAFVGAAFTIGDGASWIEFIFGYKPPQEWVYSGVFILFAIIVLYRLVKLQTKIDNQNQGKGLLEQLERLEESWLYFINNKPGSDLQYDQWKKDFANWQGKVIPHTKNEPTWQGSFHREHYNEEHLSLLHQGDTLWKTLEAKINRLKTEL